MSKKLSESNAMIVGLAKNCADGLIKTLPRLDAFKNTFKHVEYRVMINDSSDSTEGVLDKWAEGRKEIRILKQNGLDLNVPIRTARLAVCRNMCLDEYRNFNKYRKVDYYIILDLDGLNANLIDDPEFSKIIEAAPENWGALFANQRGTYYDIWALRHPTWCPTDCFVEIRQYRRNPLNWLKNGGKKKTRQIAYQKYLWDRQRPISPEADIIQVNSAFGGFGIYNTKYLENAFYLGLTKNGKQVCEHVHFNECVKNNGSSLYVNPKLLNESHQ
jgi:hypothetical protein